MSDSTLAKTATSLRAGTETILPGTVDTTHFVLLSGSVIFPNRFGTDIRRTSHRRREKSTPHEQNNNNDTTHASLRAKCEVTAKMFSFGFEGKQSRRGKRATRSGNGGVALIPVVGDFNQIREMECGPLR